MATGFTPQHKVQEATPSTDEVQHAIGQAAHLHRRAAATSPERSEQIRLHKLAHEKEIVVQQMRDLKAKGQQVFGESADASAEKKLTLRIALEDHEVARRLIHADFRPDPYVPRVKAVKEPKAALCVVPTAQFGIDAPTVVVASPQRSVNEGSLGGKLPSTISTTSLHTQPIVQPVFKPVVDKGAFEILMEKKTKLLLGSPQGSQTSSGRRELENIRAAAREAEVRLAELREMERA